MDLFTDDCSIYSAEIEELNAQVGALFAKDLEAHFGKINASRDAMLLGAKGEILRLIAGGKFSLSKAVLQSVQVKAATVDVDGVVAKEIHAEALAGDANVRNTTVDAALLQATGMARAVNVSATRTLELSGHDTAVLSSNAPQTYLTSDGGSAQAFGHGGEDLIISGDHVRVQDSQNTKLVLANAAKDATVYNHQGPAKIIIDAGHQALLRGSVVESVTITARDVLAHSVKAAEHSYSGSSTVIILGQNVGKVKVVTQHLGAHGQLKGSLSATTKSAVISQHTQGDLEVDASGAVILTGPTTGKKTKIRAATNLGICRNPSSTEVELTFDRVFDVRQLTQVDDTVDKLTVVQTGLVPMWLRNLVATASSTTIISAGTIDGRKTKITARDLILASKAHMDLHGAKGTIKGTFTRAVGLDADFSDTTVEATKVTSLVEGNANFTKAAERAPTIEHQVKGRAELTGASFIARMVQSDNPTQAALATHLLFLAGEITGSPTVIRDRIWGGYQERIGQRPTFICDGKTVVLAESLFHLVAPYIRTRGTYLWRCKW